MVGEIGPRAGRHRRGPGRGGGGRAVWVEGGTSACESNRVAVGGGSSRCRTPGGRYPRSWSRCTGAHQGVNAAVRPGGGRGVLRRTRSAPDVVEEGLAAVRVPGRLEVLGRRPLLLVDGAHNAAGMAALADALARSSRSMVCRSPSSGCSRDVTPRQCWRLWHRRACRRSSPASPNRRGPCRRAGRRGGACARVGRVRGAGRPRRAGAGAGMVGADGLVVVAGSLYVVGTARAMRSRRRSPGRTPAADGRRPVTCRLCSVDPSWTAPLSS